jgi:hypothetical protein
MKRASLAALSAIGLLALLSTVHESQTDPEVSDGVESPERTVRTAFSTSQDSAPVSSEHATYSPGEVMVRPAEGASIDEIAEAVGAEVRSDPGRSGYGVLAAPAGMSLADFSRALRDNAQVASLAPQGIIRGSADTGGEPGSLRSLQWHLDAASMPAEVPDLSGIVVAVLDTGVAYAAQGGHVVAPSLSAVGIVAPWDFVNDDAHAGDDHQHGTHIASIIASQGDIEGIAPGVRLMPLKVLDQDNSGYESHLVEAIWWAVDHGADIINMSLTFGADYIPSPALTAALQAASDAGIVLVGAAGNEGTDLVRFPAASPLVFSVGASCPTDAVNTQAATGYTNRSMRVDLTAPGGCIDADANGDGYPDGILAETIGLQDPSQTGPWLYAGTSQAAAMVSGAAAWLLAGGADPDRLNTFFQYNTTEDLGEWPWGEGLGAGGLDLTYAYNEVVWNSTDPTYTDRGYHASILPSLTHAAEGWVTPSATLSVVTQSGQSASFVTVWLRMRGSSEGDYFCYLTKADKGSCRLWGPTVPLHDESGAPAALAWRLEVMGVIVADLGIAYRPGGMFFASDDLSDIIGDMRADEELRDGSLAFYWPEAGYVEDLGWVAESYTVSGGGVGRGQSPSALLFTPAALPETASIDDHLDGTGIATSPFGFRKISLDGTGIATSPFGFKENFLVAFSGTGIATSPFGAQQMNLLSQSVTGCPGCELDGDVVFLDDGTIYSGNGTGSALQVMLDDGGWVDGDGYPATSIVEGNGVFSPVAYAVGSGTGDGAVPLQ